MKWLFSVLLVLSFKAQALTIGSYNIRNFDYDERSRVQTDKHTLEDVLTSISFDLLGVNEINNVPEFQNFVSRKLRGFSVRLSTCGGSHGQRLGFVYNTSKLRLLSFNEELSVTNPGQGDSCTSGSRPLGVGYFEEIATGTKFYAIQVHLKAGDNADALNKRFKQYEIIEQFVKELIGKGHKNIVLVGDFNTTGYSTRTQDYNKFTAMVRNAGLVDLSANVGCTSYWWGGTDDGIEDPSVLDHLLVTPAFKTNAQARAEVHAHCKKVSCRSASPRDLGDTYEGVSDHCPQTARIR
jgi:endonuclease/exonuclease/phosphatase family metal-dependent hydrolase